MSDIAAFCVDGISNVTYEMLGVWEAGDGCLHDVDARAHYPREQRILTLHHLHMVSRDWELLKPDLRQKS